MRVRVECASGLLSIGKGAGHVWLDVTDKPMPTILAGRPVRIEVDRRGGDLKAKTKAKVSKPPYRIPAMAEIAALRGTNGRKVVSTFSGCGGTCLGYEWAGYDVVWASEFIEEARATYALNHAAPCDGRDIRRVDPLEVLARLGLAVGELDVLEGSPPCASFSSAGRREAHWGKVKKYSDKAQRVDDLFGEFVRFVRAMRPKVFSAENVQGLVRGTAKGHFLEILKSLKACGYRVAAKVLDAAWLGVPQYRKRLIFVGVREDLGKAPAFPSPLPYLYTVRDALPWIQRVSSNKSFEMIWKSAATNPSPTVCASSATVPKYGMVEAAAPPVEPEADISRFAIGEEARRLGPGQQSDRYFSLVRAPLDGPSPTVTQTAGQSGAAGVIHPVERRKFSIAELRRICGFPDDFKLTGTYQQQWERLGRAVPPPMSYAIACAIRDRIFDGGRRG